RRSPAMVRPGHGPLHGPRRAGPRPVARPRGPGPGPPRGAGPERGPPVPGGGPSPGPGADPADLNPDEIVAMGAARMALNYEPSEGVALKDDEKIVFDTKNASPPEEITDTHIKDVVSHTLGVGLKDDVYDPLIEKDHVIPHKVARRGYTNAY